MARKSKRKSTIKRTVIICGTEKTEPLYFNDFKKYLRTNGIHIEGLEVINTKSKNQLPSKLLEYAIQQVEQYDLELESGDSVWCVFDYDDFDDDIQRVIGMKKYNKVIKIISTRCFELWYLLHFKYTTSFISNTKMLEDELTGILGKEYKKNISYFNDLLSLQGTAISNSKKLKEFHERNGTKELSSLCNPYTDVYRLVEYLNNLKAE